MVVFHHNDADGRCAAAIVFKKYSQELHEPIGFVEMDYAKSVNFSQIVAPGEQVFIVDFSFKPDVMAMLLLITENVTWIDHHESAKEYPYQFLPGVRDFSDKGHSGCELAWMFCFPEQEMPIAVKLIGDYDKWALKMQPDCFMFFEGLKLYDHSPVSSIWNDLLRLLPAAHYFILDAGKMAIRYRDRYTNDLCESYGYETEIDGVKAYACNQYRFGSKGFGDRFEKYPVCIAYIHDGQRFTVSLYSETVNVKDIAVKYGGGGHRGASGFVCDQLPWVK